MDTRRRLLVNKVSGFKKEGSTDYETCLIQSLMLQCLTSLRLIWTPMQKPANLSLTSLPYYGQRCSLAVCLTADVWCRSCTHSLLTAPCERCSPNTALMCYVLPTLQFICCMQAAKTWEGYLVSADVDSSTQGTGTPAQQLLRKRYVGIQGSNKVIGAMEIQQVSGTLASKAKFLIMALMLSRGFFYCLHRHQ